MINCIDRHSVWIGVFLAVTFAVPAAIAAPLMSLDDQRQASSKDTEVDQLTSRRAAPIDPGASDIAGRRDSDSPVTQLSGATRSSDQPQQLGPRDRTPATVGAQVTREARSAQSGAQLYHGGRTAEPVAALSTRREGKPEGTIRLTGEDRCDPQNVSAANKAECQRAIENRADEYHRPTAPVLSAEQKILIGQKLREAPDSPLTLARAVGGKDIDADSRDAQGLASIVLTPTTPPAAATKTDPNASDPATNLDTQALVNAIVAGAGAQGQIQVQP